MLLRFYVKKLLLLNFHNENLEAIECVQNSKKKKLHVNVIIDTITECLRSASKSTKHNQCFFFQFCEVGELPIMYKRN